MAFTKAPLVVLGIAMAVLLAALGAQVLRGEGTHTAAPGTDPDHDDAPDEARAGERATADAAPEQDSGPDPGTTSDTAGTAPTDRLYDPDWMVRTIAAGFTTDFAPFVDEAAANCMAREVVDMLSVDRIWEIADVITGAEPGRLERSDPSLLTDDELAELNTRLRGCVSQEAADRLNF